MRIISFIESRQHDVLKKILRHCGLWEGPLRTLSTARGPPSSDSESTANEPRELQVSAQQNRFDAWGNLSGVSHSKALDKENLMGARTKSQRRTTWRQRLARFERAGVTIAEFCRREGVSVPSFYQWRKKLAATSTSPGRKATQSPPVNDTPAPFVELALPLAARVEIELVSGAIVRFPLDGHLFLFINRRHDRLKMLYWDRDGLALWCKRLEAGTFQLPDAADEATGVELDTAQLALLLTGIDLASARRRKRYARVA
jgi:hypothetical protein